MLLNLVKRWIYSPLELVPSPIVEEARARAESLKASAEDIAEAEAVAHELFPAYELPLCRQYCQRYDAPFHGAGFALVYCEMDITHLAAMQKDTRLTIFSGMDHPLDQGILDSQAALIAPDQDGKGVAVVSAAPPATLGELLKALEQRHIKFSATE